MDRISADQLDRALARRDLTDPAAGPHALQCVVEAVERALSAAWGVPVRRDSGPRIVTVADNYDRLRYPPDAITRDRRYSHYVGDGRMLRSHTTARIPALLAGVAGETVLTVPGICYRRDVIDRQHVGDPHQMDLWRVRPDGPPLTEDDLTQMVGLVVGAVLPGRPWHTPPSEHPYTLAGREIYVDGVEIGECGLAHPEVLARSGLPPTASGLAMGLGLDRLAMLAKGVPDVRLLRSADPRVAAQMLDLSPYRPVSSMPPARRDLSLAVADDVDVELLGDRVRELLGPDADAVEEVEVRAETGYDRLPAAARERMGVRPGQKNVLVRVVLRHLTRTLTAAEANELRDRVYGGLHEGAAHEWITR
jgi:phenylalanyl-tRNA synthetase alpha chain